MSEPNFPHVPPSDPSFYERHRLVIRGFIPVALIVVAGLVFAYSSGFFNVVREDQLESLNSSEVQTAFSSPVQSPPQSRNANEPSLLTNSQNGNPQNYTNSSYGFSLQYPPNYQVSANKYWDSKLTTIVAFKRTDAEGVIYVNTDGKPFTADRIAQDYPVNGSEVPTRLNFGTNTFYNFSGGGGGVLYPDIFYFNLNGKLLQVVFNGTYAADGNHPDDATKAVEQKILADFMLLK